MKIKSLKKCNAPFRRRLHRRCHTLSSARSAWEPTQPRAPPCTWRALLLHYHHHPTTTITKWCHTITNTNTTATATTAKGTERPEGMNETAQRHFSIAAREMHCRLRRHLEATTPSRSFLRITTSTFAATLLLLPVLAATKAE